MAGMAGGFADTHFNFVFCVMGMGGLRRAYRIARRAGDFARRRAGRLSVPAGVGIIAALLLALGSSLWSFARLALTLFPYAIVGGVAWGEGRRWLPLLYVTLAATLSGLLMALFANWWWAG